VKRSKGSQENKHKSHNQSEKFNFYGTIAAVGVGIASFFFFGFWLMSLFDRAKDNPAATNPIAPIATNPTNPVSPSPLTPTTPAINPSTPNSPSTAKLDRVTTALPSSSPAPNKGSIAYRVIGESNFKSSDKLQKIVDRVVNYSTTNKLPISALSVTLIDANTGEKAGYNFSVGRYPASVVKLFWLAAIYQKIDTKEADEASLQNALGQMMFQSDNNSASQIVDTLTKTKSTTVELPAKELLTQKQKRQSLNDFFQKAGYSMNLNVSQKTFPIPAEKMEEPRGLDRQLRGGDTQKPIRNKLTTDDAARLMYEIVTDRSISPTVSQKMKKLLSRNIDSKVWKKIPLEDFNPVESFFGEGLSVKEAKNIVSKAGWTPLARQEVAFIESKDGKTRYILAIFGDDAAYGKNKKIFPTISNLVYSQMRQLSK
jgi:Beta-lactamase enzyme family